MHENAKLKVLNIDDILPNRFQPRIRFDGDSLEQLAESISKFGVIEPIVVRPVDKKYEIIAGERRYKASKLASKSTIPAIIIDLSDKDSEELALLENIQRQALNPIEEAVSYKRILDAGYITREELSKKIGKPQSVIFNKIRLLSLSDEVQSYLLNNKISERHARSLLKLTDLHDQVEMLHRIVNERLTVKKTDREIKAMLEVDKESKQVENVQSVSSNEGQVVEKLFEDEKGKENMDIDKIMREAKDINAEPVVTGDVPNLMANQNGEVTVTPNVPDNTDNNNSGEVNKFVNIGQDSPVKTNENSQPTSMFDSMFATSVNNMPAAPQPLSSGSEAPAITPLSPADSSQPEPQATPTPVAAAPVETPAVPTASVEAPVSPATPATPAAPEVPAAPAANSIPVQPTEQNVPVKDISNIVANAFKKYNDEESQAVPAVNPAPVAAAPVETPAVPTASVEAPVAPVSPVTPAAPQPVNTNVPDINVYPSSTESVVNNNDNDNDVLKEYQQPAPATSVAPAQPTVPTPPASIASDVSAVPNFAKIVKMLRDCADEIEKTGHYVNMDEIDLGDQYKVIFTIDK